MKMFRVALTSSLVLLASCASIAPVKSPSIIDNSVPLVPAIASAHPLATKAGMDILAQGGNAFDAAVAVTAALAVVEPYSSGLGGGGFWLIHRAEDGFETMIDGRETMPAAGHRDMYIDEESGQVIPGLSMNGPMSAGIPGVPAALTHLTKKYGKLPLKDSLAHAIKYAQEGFIVDDYYRRLASFRKDVLTMWPESRETFLDKGEVPAKGFIIKQPDLAKTLEAMSTQGRDGFYKGEVARKIVEGVKSAGGIFTQQDLDNYKIVEREPVRANYRGVKVTSAAPPSSGGIALVEMFNILSGYDLEKEDEITRKHLIVEAMRRAYRDRAIYLGDPDFIDVPVEVLTSPVYAAGLRASIRKDKATPSTSLPGLEAAKESFHTTHFSILDAEGNRVSATVTVNYPFGSGFVVPGTGILLNDEMDDFSSKPGVPNAYGLVGAEANAIAPNKRPLSSMSPTFLETDDSVAIIGTPGGSRIITMVLLGSLDYIAGNKPESWVSLGRFHHQYLPDRIQYESDALTEEEIKGLFDLGHDLQKTRGDFGNMQAILWNKRTGEVSAASDPRGVGASEIGTLNATVSKVENANE